MAETTDAHRILIVEDEEVVMHLLVRLLRENIDACLLETARDGIAGSARVCAFRPHLVILDLHMLAMDAVQFCRRVKSLEDSGGGQVLVITGHAGDPRLEAALVAGADDWLAKHLIPAMLLPKVTRMLGIPDRDTARPAAPLASGDPEGAGRELEKGCPSAEEERQLLNWQMASGMVVPDTW